MTKKHESNKEELNRTDTLIVDYLLDVLGAESSDCSGTLPISKFFNHERPEVELHEEASVVAVSIQQDCFLVPTIKLLTKNAYKERYSKVQAVFILLSSLYFLRRPLTPKVRQCFLSLSEQVINDYQFSEFKQRMTREGVYS